MGSAWWSEELTDVCSQFQVDLSCLVDGELDQQAASRAILHLEGCTACRDFFESARLQIKLHLDMANPERLLERFEDLTGVALQEELEAFDLVHKLASIFYQLGKAYVLLATDPDFYTRVFEAAVKVEPTRTHGRGFVDGVLGSGRSAVGGVDWTRARHLLNGKLSKIEDPLEKGRRLIKEALSINPDYEEARLYLAFIHLREGKTTRAASELRRIFNTALSEVNRGHAAVQLGKLYGRENDYRKALACFRWVTISGLADREEKFYFVRFNISVCYANLGDRARSLKALRDLLDRHPGSASELASLFARSDELRAVILGQPGFAEELYRSCPELFDAARSQDAAEDPGADRPGSGEE